MIMTLCVGAALVITLNANAQPGGGGGSGRPGGSGGFSGGARGGGDAYGSGIADDVTFQFDPETGSLIVMTDEATNEYIKQIIEKLDQPVPQVLINVLFLEVTHTRGLDLGFEGTFKYDGLDGENNEKDIVQTLFGVASQVDGGIYKIIEDDFDIAMRALATVAKLEVLSRPSILVRNNESAIITIGQEVPFIQNSRVTEQGQIINTVQYEDIGIILDVTPHITADGLVEMDVAPEISTITGQTVQISAGVEAPVFAKRSAETRVVVQDGKTVVIGGLMEDNETETIRKVPILGDIPLIGVLFRRTITDKSKTELLIFLTPHVIENAAELASMSAAERGKAELLPEAFTDEQLDKYLDGNNE